MCIVSCFGPPVDMANHDVEICSLNVAMQNLEIGKMQKMKEDAKKIKQISAQVECLVMLPAGVQQMIV